MRHLTKDLVLCVEAKKRQLKPAELCALWRNAPYQLAFNELAQEVEHMAYLCLLRTLRRRTSACLKLVMRPIPKQLLTGF